MRLGNLSTGTAVVLTLVLTACTVAPPPVPATPATLAVSAVGSFGTMLNAQRATAGLPAATSDARLATAAQAHAADMQAQNYFSHTGLDGRSSADRVRAAGYVSCRPSEVIAFGQQSEAEVLQTWVNSPPHLANIMMRGPVQYGLGHAGTKWVLIVAGVC